MFPHERGDGNVCTPLEHDLPALLGEYGVQQRFRFGQVIFYEGHIPLGVYVHESGRVRLVNESGVECTCVGPCAMGLRARVAGIPLSHTALPLGDVRITFLSRSAWNVFIQEHPSLSLEAIPIGPNPSRGVPFP